MLPSFLAATAAQAKRTSPCNDAIETLFGIGAAFLWTALGFAVIAALAALYRSLRPSPAPPDLGPRAIPDPAPFVDALLKLIEGLAKAPAWLAMFACGALLFWMGAAMSDGHCGNAPETPAEQHPGGADAKGRPSPKPSPTTTPTPSPTPTEVQ